MTVKTQLKIYGIQQKQFLRGKCIAIHSYLKKQEKNRRDNLTLHLKQLEIEEQKKNAKLVEGKKS